MCSSFSKKCNWPLCKDFLRDTRQRPVHVAGFFYLGALPWRISNKERRMMKMPFNIHYSLFLFSKWFVIGNQPKNSLQRPLRRTLVRSLCYSTTKNQQLFCWYSSGGQDSNLRPRGPKPRILPG